MSLFIKKVFAVFSQSLAIGYPTLNVIIIAKTRYEPTSILKFILVKIVLRKVSWCDIKLFWKITFKIRGS